jgi:hypothetical protein
MLTSRLQCDRLALRVRAESVDRDHGVTDEVVQMVLDGKVAAASVVIGGILADHALIVAVIDLAGASTDARGVRVQDVHGLTIVASVESANLGMHTDQRLRA